MIFVVRCSFLHPQVRQQEGDDGGHPADSGTIRPRPLLQHRLREGEDGLQQTQVGARKDSVTMNEFLFRPYRRQTDIMV